MKVYPCLDGTYRPVPGPEYEIPWRDLKPGQVFAHSPHREPTDHPFMFQIVEPGVAEVYGRDGSHAGRRKAIFDSSSYPLWIPLP